MKQEWKDALCKKYPGAFTDTCAITVRDGWFDLIQCIAHDVHTRREQGSDVIITNVRQKLGQIRVQVRGGGDYESGMTMFALYMSQLICEECGDRGEMRNHKGQLLTACDKHFKEFVTEYDERMCEYD